MNSNKLKRQVLKGSLVCGLWFAVYLLSPFSAYSLSIDDVHKDYILGNYDQAIRGAQNLKETDKTLYFLGLAYIKNGSYSKARIFLRKLVRRFPRSRLYSRGLVKLADTYFLQKDYENAAELYKEIKIRNSRSNNMPLVLLRLTQIASHQGDWEKKNEYIQYMKEKYPVCLEMKFIKILEGYGDFFTIQIGAFNEKKNAFCLCDDLSKKYKTYIEKEQRDSRIIYKVRAGKWKNRYEAQKIAAQLLDEGYPARICP